MATLSMPSLFGLTVASDLIIVSTIVPLQRVSLQAAHDNAPPVVILGLLLANLALLGLVGFAMYASGRFIARIVRPSQDRHKIGRGREEVSLSCDTCANFSSESAPQSSLAS